MTLVMTLVLVAAIAVFVGGPLSGPRVPVERPKSGEATRLQEIKKANYQALKDIEEEYATGKLSQEDYAALRAHFLQKAAEILKDLDAHSQNKSAGQV